MTVHDVGLGPSTLSFLDRLGTYTVSERIAAGAHGEVYRAWDREHRRDVALKVSLPELAGDERLRREAGVLERIRHPNVVELYGYGCEDGIGYMAMEFVEATSLADLIAGGPLPAEEIVELGTQVANALAAVHRQGVLHRDVKAGNVLVTAQERAVLIDFGLADDAATPGPLRYRPPELLRGKVADDRADVYSLGVVLYRMAGAAWPFNGDDEAPLRQAILERPPGKLDRRLDARLRRVIVKCLAKEPAQRWPAADLATALESCR